MACLLPEESNGLIVGFPLRAVHEGFDGVEQILLGVEQSPLEFADMVQEIGIILLGQPAELLAEGTEPLKERIPGHLVEQNADVARLPGERLAGDLSGRMRVGAIVGAVEKLLMEPLEGIDLGSVELFLETNAQ